MEYFFQREAAAHRLQIFIRPLISHCKLTSLQLNKHSLHCPKNGQKLSAIIISIPRFNKFCISEDVINAEVSQRDNENHIILKWEGSRGSELNRITMRLIFTGSLPTRTKGVSEFDEIRLYPEAVELFPRLFSWSIHSNRLRKPAILFQYKENNKRKECLKLYSEVLWKIKIVCINSTE